MIKKILFCAFVFASAFISKNANAQNPFPYNESFTRSSSNTPDLVMGAGQGSGPAFLTGGNLDAEGAGYLRLTSNGANQAGFARSQKVFPSVNGVEISFNYYIYGGSVGSADGITFFLFDADVVNRTKVTTDGLGLNYPLDGFNIGAFGGALGYAQRNTNPGIFPFDEDPGDLPGVSLGYLGIGLDEFGKFTQPVSQDGEGRQGGPGQRPNSVVLRGKGDGAGYLGGPNYTYLTHRQTTDAPSMSGIGDGATFTIPGLVDGRTGGGITSSNPGFRKAQITLTPILPSGFNVRVILTVGGASPQTYEVINTDYTEVPPNNLSFGFAGSTGSENNYHEIQNIEIVVPASQPQIPVLADIAKTGLEDATMNFAITDFTAGFLDPNGINTLTEVQVKTLPANGILYLGTVQPGNEVVVDQIIPKANLVNLKFVPTAHWNGSTSFDWNGRDDTQYAAQFEQVNITITPVNDLPLTDNKTVAGVENTGYTFVAGDFAFSDPIDAANGAQGTHAISGVKVITIPGLGTLRLNGVDVIDGQTIPIASIIGGLFTYVPVASATGTPYTTFPFQVQDNGTTANGGVDLSLQKTMTINIAPLPTITLTSSNTNKCVGTSPASLPYTATGASPNQYSIVFDGAALGAGFVNVTNAVLPASPITIVVPGAAAAAVYNATLTVRNTTSGLTSTGVPITITLKALPTVAAITGTLSVCEAGSAGNTTQLANATAGGSWSSSNPAVATVSAGGLVTGVTAGTVTITYTTAPNGDGCTNSTTAIVTVNAKPAVAAITGTLSVCEAGSPGTTTQLANATTGGSWSSSNPAVATVSPAGLVTGVAAGSVTISYTTAPNGSGCTNTATATVTVNAKPAVAAITGTLSVCEAGSAGNTTQLANATAGGSWSSSNPAVATVSPAGLVTGLTAGTVTITYTTAPNGSGCTNTATATVTVNAKPAVAAITGTLTVCEAGSAGNTTQLANATAGGSWSSSNPAVATVSPAGLVSGVTAGTVTISYTTAPNGSGCTNTATATVTVNAKPAVAAITGTLTVCEAGSPGNTTQLANATAGGSWSSSNPAVATVSPTGLVTGVTAGTVTISYTTAPNGSGCTNTATATVTVNAKPAVAAITGTLSVCAGLTTQLANATAGGSWSSSNPTVATVSNTGLVTGVTAGTVTISYTTAPNGSGCTSTAISTVTINALPTATISYAGGPFCATGTVAVAHTGQTGGTYSSTAGLTINAASGLINLASSTPGTYTVTYSFTNGTCSNTTTTSITINALPTVAAISGASGTTVGSTTTFSNTTSGGVWSSDNTAVATVSSSGVVTGVSVGTAVITYTVTSGGCTNSVTKSITITTPPVNNAPPVVQNITKSGVKDQTITFTAANFSDTDHYSDPESVALVKVKIVSLPSTGTLKLDGVNITAGQEIPAADLSKITFVPATGYTGTVTFDWNGSDGVNYATTAKTVTITLVASNTPPIIADITKTGTKDTPVPFTSTDFTDKFTDTDPLVKIKVVTLPNTGTLKLNGVNITIGQEIPAADLAKITFVPATGYTGGPVSFQWNGSDGIEYAASPKNVNITINATNTAPVAVADTYTTTRGGTLTVSLPGVLTNDTDADGNSLNAIKVTDPVNGTVTLNSNGSFIYTHNGGNSTSDVFTYKVNDGTADGNTVSVSITVTSVNGPPLVYDLTKIGTGFTPITFTPQDFRDKYTDPNSDPLVKIMVTSLPPVGTLKLNGVAVGVGQEIPVASLGNLTFEPPVNWSGTTSFGWNGFDGTVYATNPANVSLQVLLAGDPTAKIGLAKSLASAVAALNGTYDVKFIFTAVNYGLNGLENISIKDNLLLAFGGATVSVKSIVGFGNLKVNNSYNGSSDTELLLATSKLFAGEQARVELVINVKLGLTGGLFQNTATAQGTSSVNGVKVTDISTNGLKPDPLTTNDVSPSDATPIQLDLQPTYVPQGFSPNGDGQNDKFIIQNALGKLVSLEVYNRWGNRVYKSADYKNDWGGEVTEGFFLGRDIPDGTYYYIIIIENKDKYAGFITINR